jgi:hypothetical protein
MSSYPQLMREAAVLVVFRFLCQAREGRGTAKPLPIILFVGWLFLTSWGTPQVRADESKSAVACAPSQSAVKRFSEDSGEAACTPQASGCAAGSEGPGSSPGMFRKWYRMGERLQEEQPDWLSPIVTTSGRLKQEFRYDAWRQPTLRGETDYNFGGGKGLELIIAPRTQLLVGPPSYVSHAGADTRDGFGDIPLMLKFRVVSSGAREGNYLLTLLLSATVPGGTNATQDAVLSPAIAFGKGWGKIDVQSTLGANLPTSDTAALGRQLLSNTALQYRIFRMLWPEIEVNSTFFLVGKNAGQTQVFLTPGLGFGRIRLWRALRFSTGAGMQIAVTRFHTYNHRAVFSVRYSF